MSQPGGTTALPKTAPAPSPLPGITTSPGPQGAKPTLTLSSASVELGGTLTLTGVVQGAPAGQKVELISQSCGFADALPIVTTKTAAGGAFTFKLQPMLNATFAVRSGNAISDVHVVRVRPTVAVKRLSASSFGVDVSTGAGAFLTRPATLERYDLVHRRWRAVGTGTLRKNSPGDAIIAISSATIRAKAPPGSTVRVVLSQATVGRCYQATKSSAFKS